MQENELIRTNDIRSQVTFFLLFLTSDACLEACDEIMPREKLAFELCRIWFDEIYAPGQSYLESIKGDFSPEDVEAFEEAFEVEELIDLERFHHFFELRMKMLAEKYKRDSSFPDNDMWRNLTRSAAHVLKEIEPNAAQLRSVLEEKVETAVRQRGRLLEGEDWRRLLGNA